MRLYDGGVVTLIVILSIAIVAGLISVKFEGKDNVIEQAAEEVIDSELHLPAGTAEKLEEDVETVIQKINVPAKSAK